MARKFVDCRETPGINRFTGRDCTVVVSGDEEELLQLSVQHGVSAHGYEDTPEFRELILEVMKDEAELTAKA